MENYNRQCPYCGCHITVSDNNSDEGYSVLSTRDKTEMKKKLFYRHIVCPNEECGKTIINPFLTYNASPVIS